LASETGVEVWGEVAAMGGRLKLRVGVDRRGPRSDAGEGFGGVF